MGAFASHIIFGWEGKKKWQECGMLSVCRKHQGIFEMGCTAFWEVRDGYLCNAF